MCIRTPRLLYPLICGWALRLLPRLAYGKHHHYEYWGHVSLQIGGVGFASYIDVRRSGTAVSCGSSTLSFLRRLHTALHGGCTRLHPHQQGKRAPFSPHSCQHLLCVLFDDGHSDRSKVTVVSIRISITDSDAEHLLI